MALISCPECAREVSDKAASCPGCGYPISNNQSATPASVNDDPICPVFPSDLSIGKAPSMFSSARMMGTYKPDGNSNENLKDGSVIVAVHEHGVRISDSGWVSKPVDVHRSQIIACELYTTSVDHNISKSVIGRAIVGGLLTGGIGAVVGGISGIGSKTKTKVEDYLLLQYWRVSDQKIQTFLFKGDRFMIDNFLKAYNK